MKFFCPLFLLLFFVHTTKAQYCGYVGNPSGPSQCNHQGIAAPTGLSPSPDSLPPFTNGVASTTVLQLRTGTIIFGGSSVQVNWVRIDSIGNLPEGLCWATDTANNTFSSAGGCIKINGTPCAAPGQYKLVIKVTANIGLTFSTDGDAAGLKYYVRVNNSGDAIIDVDTTQTASTPFSPCGHTKVCPISGIGDKYLSESISLSPNPATDELTITTEENHEPFDLSIYDLMGNLLQTHKNISDRMADINVRWLLSA